MQTITWNRRYINGTVEKVTFTRLFSSKGGVEEFATKVSLEIIARRQGLIRSKEQFLEEMNRLSLEHEISVLTAQTAEEIALSGEYFGTQAMLATVRYGLSDLDEVSSRGVIRRFEKFVNEVFQRSSRELVSKVS